MTKNWFEMHTERKRRIDGSVWVPLRAVQTIQLAGERGQVGYSEEFFAAASIAVPVKMRHHAESLGWSDLNISRENRAWIDNRRYLPSDVYESHNRKVIAVSLVLVQKGNRVTPQHWHLHQDIVVSLGLTCEKDSWYAIDEGYVEVARLLRADYGHPVRMEMKAEHLKDYLCARKMALYINTYRSRIEILVDDPQFDWPDPIAPTNPLIRWEARVTPIHEDGMPFGATTAVFHVARTDVLPDEDVPVLGIPDDTNTTGENWTVMNSDRKLYRVHGELWRSEWIEPGTKSPRIRGDKIASTTSFIVDASGTLIAADDLKDAGRWLWFRPEVVPALIKIRSGGLEWYTRDTGGVWCSPNSTIYFGVNSLGLVVVYAKDVAWLSEWQRRLWAGYNIAPAGGISDELYASQVKAEAVDTLAPEEYLICAIDKLQSVTLARWGVRVLRDHAQLPELFRSAHRFRAIDSGGLYALAKDLARITADSIDAKALHKITPPPKGDHWQSIKSLEKVLATKIGDTKARTTTGRLAGIYDLRLADAHLATTDIGDALRLAEVDPNAPPVFQGYQLLYGCVSSLYTIADLVEKNW